MSERITLEDLRPADGATSKTKRVGRGRASGHGKTSCRGNNGEGQRSGRSSKRGFEGGQMPGYRQMPKLKGFTNFNAIKYAEINVCDFETLGKDEITLEVLKEMGKAHSSTEELRVLGCGDLTKAVTVSARYFTASAKEKIEKAGGKAQLV
ncbi:MAG: 50S ribosomal protein L15 [Candidatus Gastranaerophilales bacterium]|nr:50S ribosomal protein L15 [Candidatus Gastranaerophilales bacterium]